MTNNPNFYGQSTAGTPNQIEDGVDFPHTGLIKALSTGIAGRYALDGFNTSSITATSLTVADGNIMYNGRLISVTGSTETITSTYTNGYHLLVAIAPSTSTATTTTLAIRNPTVADKVPAYTEGDTIIAVLTHTGANPMHIQYLTYYKRENAMSISYDSGATITEAGRIDGTGSGIEIVADDVLNNGQFTLLNKNNDRDFYIKTTDTGGTENNALFIDTSDSNKAYFNGEVSANGQILTRNNITNNADNRVLTATSNADEHNAEANMTFDGVTLALTGSYTATGGLDTGLAVNAGTSLSSVTTTDVGSVLTANEGNKTMGWFAAGAIEILDVAHSLVMSGANSYIYIGDLTTASPTNTITLPAASSVSGRLFTFKNIGNANINIVPFAGDLIDNGIDPAIVTTGSISLTAANTILLEPLKTITLHALGFEEIAPAPLSIGYYIVGSTA